jgi:8-oxo-dGTP pyrophosphatase MutT (NUDIX family)
MVEKRGKQKQKGKYRKAVFCVGYAKTKKGIRYLLLKRKLHWRGWEFPKGKIEWYEVFKKGKTALREFKEETGLEPKRKTLKKQVYWGKYLYKKPLKDRPGKIGQTFSLYSVEVPYSKKIKLDKKEHAGFKWVSFKQALKLLTWKNQKDSLKIVDNWLKKN